MSTMININDTEKLVKAMSDEELLAYLQAHNPFGGYTLPDTEVKRDSMRRAVRNWMLRS